MSHYYTLRHQELIETIMIPGIAHHHKHLPKSADAIIRGHEHGYDY